MPKLVLSIDGGGIRGIIPAVVLQEIEAKLDAPIREIFDLVVGTSTGAILSAALCSTSLQYSARDMVEFYKTHGHKIFQGACCRKTKSWLKGAMYSCTNLEGLFQTYFKEDTVADVSCRLMITTYDIKNNEPFFIKSWRPERNSIKIKDALRAATAAPTYFSPKLLVVDETRRVLIDGGIFANNPAACAYATARRIFPEEDIILLSIGTGMSRKSIRFPRAKAFGKITWINPLLDVMFEAGLEHVNYQLSNLMKERYIRVQINLTKGSVDLDDTSTKNIKNLRKEGLLAVQQYSQEIDKFCKYVRNTFLTK